MSAAHGTRLRWAVAILVAGIVVVGAWLRLRALGFGLPDVHNMDEVAIMSRTLSLAARGPDPGNFLYPSFYFYALFAWLGATFLLLRASGLVASLQAFETSYFVDPTAIYLSGRLLTALLGTATLVIVYFLGRRLHGRIAGIAACAFLACAPFAVQDAHYVKHDVPATFLIALALLAMSVALVPREGKRPERWLAAAAVATGLAIATHYYAVFLLPPLAVAAIRERRARPERAWLPLAVLAIAGVTAFVASPFVVIRWETALRDIAANRAIVIDRAAGEAHWTARVLAYGDLLWRDAIGWPVALLAAVGAVLLWRRSAPAAAVLIGFLALFFAFICQTVVATRYLNPLLPGVAALAGVTVGALAARLEDTRIGRVGIVLAAAVIAVAVWPGARASWQTGTFFGRTDTRSQASEFIERTVPSGATVLVQPYSAPLRQSREGLKEALAFHLGDVRRASTRFARQLELDPYPEPAYRLLWLGAGGLDTDKIYLSPRTLAAEPAALIERWGIEYVVLKRYNVPDRVEELLLPILQEHGRRIATFTPYVGDAGSSSPLPAPFLHNTDARLDPRLERPGPIVEVWRVQPTR